VQEEGEKMSNLPKKILLATDGSEDARLAGQAAASLADNAGAELHDVQLGRAYPTPLSTPTITRKGLGGSWKKKPSSSPAWGLR
jgi:nucleotide-binding universal stress UspA family protein